MSPVAERRRGRAQIGLYGLWQFRDYLMDRGLPTAIVTSLFGYLTVAPMLPRLHNNLANIPPALIAKWGGPAQAKAVIMGDFNELFLRSFLGAVVFLGALFAMNGIVANDRKQGFYRFLFAKPLTPMRYYGQAFLIHWAGFLGIISALATLYGILIWPLLTLHLFYVLALMFLMYAGIAFVLSAAARWDWLSLVAVTVFSTFVWDRFGASASPLARLLYLLPPLHRTSDMYMTAAKGDPLDWPLLWWYAGYGVACYVIGLVVLRYRRLAIV